MIILIMCMVCNRCVLKWDNMGNIHNSYWDHYDCWACPAMNKVLKLFLIEVIMGPESAIVSNTLSLRL